jgi:RimJ/RimL family protein N-acetyltransferase
MDACVTLLDRQPNLSNADVALRPLAADDWTALYDAASDPLIWAGHPAHDRWQEPVFRRFFEDALASGGALAALDPATGAVIGSSRYDHDRAEAGEIEIGWTFLARSHWGGASNAAMKALMVCHALKSVDRVIFLIGETNLRSRRAMEKIGGVLTPRHHDAIMNGAAVRHLIYAIDATTFSNGPLARLA